MATHYGARFADAWRGVNPDEMKADWAAKLGSFTPEQITQAVKSLDECKFPPTLPEFVALCRKAQPQMYRLCLPTPPLTREQKDEGLGRFAAIKRELGWIRETTS